MNNQAHDGSRADTLRTVDRNTERTSRACSLLFQAWMQMGSEMVVGSTRVVADTLQDLNELYCDPRGGPACQQTAVSKPPKDVN